MKEIEGVKVGGSGGTQYYRPSVFEMIRGVCVERTCPMTELSGGVPLFNFAPQHQLGDSSFSVVLLFWSESFSFLLLVLLLLLTDGAQRP